MDNITLQSLIEEQKQRLHLLKYTDVFEGYKYPNMTEYHKWVAKVIRFVGIEFPNDISISEFEEISKQEIFPYQQQQLLAILEALSDLPTVIPKDKQRIDKETIPHNTLNVNTNINNSNNQSQIQEQSVLVFLNAIKDDLTGRQIKELKAVVAEHNNDLDKARPSIIDKLKSFGIDVASNIVANIITNPTIWGGM